MVERLDQLLQACTVKITVPGQMGWGTGFFVAPGLILTCAHVVKALEPDATAEIACQQQNELMEATIAQLISAFDLALLKLTSPQPAHLPCVYLDQAFHPTDDFYIYGYPDHFPEGASVTSQCEGDACENEVPLILFKSALIRPGLSGSPLLNLRTGKVCGIVKFTRDRSIDLGGGAIPTFVILGQLPQLIELQQQFHRQDQQWSVLMAMLLSEGIGRGDHFVGDQITGDKVLGDRFTGDKVAGNKITVNVFPNGAASVPNSFPKFGVPMPRVRLPENFVPRPDALNAVKAKLLAKDDRTLVVSAISGLGGLGKSVLATALVLDSDVQERFADGILWVTLGQNPDLQTMLGEWIRELDKSREAFSANTLESASRYLDNLLAERRMLLVVDDVWNSAHAEWFRVGGSGCRVLVTTREAQVEGAEYYSLDLMTEAEAIAFVQKKLGQQWRSEQEAEVKAFAKMLGYLPLALDLAANQVQDGITWAELRAEFGAERRAVALEVLDWSEAWEQLDEEQQRKYSLRACFNLSLKRLKPEQLRQFSWLGVLPEDVNLTAPVASVLWDLPLLKAKKGLIDLRRRSFLIDGVATSEGEPTYQVHDLMHDIARGLIEEGTLDLPIQNLKSKIRNLPLAHRLFLERYRELAADHCWDKLSNDGYIHRHLTWHLEQADWADELHALMAMSDAQGRNAWFEACDRIGQPAIFVEDVARGWRLAEQGYEQDPTESIVLQCRYALITATLNSLIINLPVGMMAEFVKHQFWSVEQAWAYVEQIQDENKVAEAIQALAPYLSKSLFQVAVCKAREIQDEAKRAEVLSNLVKLDGTGSIVFLNITRWIQLIPSVLRCDSFSEALETTQSILSVSNGADFTVRLEAAKLIQDEDLRAEALISLAKDDGADFSEAFEIARSIRSEERRALALSRLAQVDGADFDALLQAARSIQHEDDRASALISLAKADGDYFSEALDAARSIQFEEHRALALSRLAQVDSDYFSEALDAARSIQFEYSRALALVSLVQIDGADFTALLQAARSIQDENCRALALASLTQVDGADFNALLEAARSIQHESYWPWILHGVAQVNSDYFSKALEAARSIRDEGRRAWALVGLAQIDGDYFSEALDATRLIRDEESWAWALSNLTQVNGADFTALLQAARSIQDENCRAEALRSLAQVNNVYFSEALEAASEALDVSPSTLDEYRRLEARLEALISLAQVDGADFTALLEVVQSIRDEDYRAWILRNFAQVDGADFMALLQATRSIQNEESRAWASSNLARVDSAYFSEALEAARSIQYEYWRARALISLAQVDSAYFSEALEAARSIQDENCRALELAGLARVDSAYFSEALEAARSIQNEYSRARALSRLAQVDSAYFSEALEYVQNELMLAIVLPELVQVNDADFTVLFEAVRSQDFGIRAEELSSLAQVKGADFAVLLETARSIQDEYGQAKVLSSLIQQAPEDFLSNLWEAMLELNHKPNHAKALSAFLTRLSLTTLSYSDWQTYLHLLTHRKRSNLMQDLVTLYPAILHLGGETAMRGVVNAMKEVCSQWK